MKKLTKAQLRKKMAALGALGGRKRAKALSPRRRKQIAKNAIRTRWSKTR